MADRIEKNEAFYSEVRALEERLKSLKSADKGDGGSPEEFIAETRAVITRYPDENGLWFFLLKASDLVDDKAKKKEILEEISALKGEEFSWVAKDAGDQLWALNKLGHPLELQFISHDGRFVDLQKMKGKVVLVYFCAGWCAPCRVEGKRVKALYDKTHEEGFEVVGISFDKTEKDLEAYTKVQGYEWPQLFREEAWTSEFARENRIQSIPTLWLIDRKGKLVDMHGRADLEKKVAKLLAENLE